MPHSRHRLVQAGRQPRVPDRATNVGHPPGALTLRREDDGEVLCDRCVLADTFWRRLRGLFGQRELEPGQGIALRPSWSVHTFFMPYAIDVVFVDPDQVVAKVVGNLRPWRVVGCRGARDVIELRSGESARLGISIGDRLAWAARPTHPLVAAAQSANRPTTVSVPLGDRTRVLLSSGDDRFLRLTRFLLTRNQFEVEVTKRPSKVLGLVETRHFDVVVIDATNSLADAARAVAAIDALHRDVAVLVVSEGNPASWPTGLKVAEKWECLETLPGDIRILADGQRHEPVQAVRSTKELQLDSSLEVRRDV